MLAIKQHEGKILFTESTKPISSWLSIAQQSQTDSQLSPSMGQMWLVKGTQMCFLPTRVKIKSKTGKQKLDRFLRNLQKQHFTFNRILIIMMPNVMLVPTESIRAIKLKRENERHTLGHKKSFGTFF
jgi:hypothetical protein